MSALDHGLHLVAWIALRAMSPPDAHRVVLRVGGLLPQRRSTAAVRRAAKKLRRGTCLSRALTIAARAPGSEVVIGVQPPGTFGAHAWVELDGAPLQECDRSGAEIARLRRAAKDPLR
jgi:hypothetical protein